MIGDGSGSDGYCCDGCGSRGGSVHGEIITTAPASIGVHNQSEATEDEEVDEGEEEERGCGKISDSEEGSP